MFRIATVFIVGLILTGCSDSYKLTRANGEKHLPLLSRSGAVYVLQPTNGSYEGAEYRTSGSATAEAISFAFTPYASRVERSKEAESFSSAMAHCRGGSLMYLVEPTILHWEDRNTEWSGRSDKMTLQIVVYDVASQQSIDTTTIEGKSKWATFGGDHPQDLLPKPLKEYVAQMYRAPASGSTKDSSRPE
ncbi:MAG: DUF4823 domain-containing protein [Phycisphaerales bacterium]|jgi:hypothetical protein